MNKIVFVADSLGAICLLLVEGEDACKAVIDNDLLDDPWEAGGRLRVRHMDSGIWTWEGEGYVVDDGIDEAVRRGLLTEEQVQHPDLAFDKEPRWRPLFGFLRRPSPEELAAATTWREEWHQRQAAPLPVHAGDATVTEEAVRTAPTCTSCASVLDDAYDDLEAGLCSWCSPRCEATVDCLGKLLRCIKLAGHQGVHCVESFNVERSD